MNNLIPDSLFPLTAKQHSLQVYDSLRVPPHSKTVILSSYVFDGIGDLEHVLHAARHLQKMRQNEPFPLHVWLDIEKDVPEEALKTKLLALAKIGVDSIHGRLPGISEDVILEKAKFLATRVHPCVISISTESIIPAIRLAGSITEYGGGCFWDRTLNYLTTGFYLSAEPSGVWISDDPVFQEAAPEVSERLQTQLFGQPIPSSEMENWEVGFASLREDKARLAWIRLLFTQIKPGKNLVLGLSPFHERASKNECVALAIQQGFTEILELGRDRKIRVLSSLEKTEKRTLRLVHAFIKEEDFPAMIHLSQKLSLGGAGDTSIIRGFKGAFPVFIEARDIIQFRWEEMAEFVQSRGFPKLHEWFMASIHSNWPPQCDGELTQEWDRFRKRVIRELDISPWVDRYVRRCIFVSGPHGDTIQGIEQDYRDKKIDLSTYQSRIAYTVNNANFG